MTADTPTPYTPPDGLILTTMGEARRIGHGEVRIVSYTDWDPARWCPISASDFSDDRIVWWRPDQPATERVPLHKVIGRRLPGQTAEVKNLTVHRDPQNGVVTVWARLLAVGCQEALVPVGSDGTVDVLVEDDR